MRSACSDGSNLPVLRPSRSRRAAHRVVPAQQQHQPLGVQKLCPQCVLLCCTAHVRNHLSMTLFQVSTSAQKVVVALPAQLLAHGSGHAGTPCFGAGKDFYA